MTGRGEKFPEEERAHGAESPGVVEDEEELERRLPPGVRGSGGPVTVAVFPRRELQWTKKEGGASVDRSRHAQGGVEGLQGPRGSIKARAGDIRKLTDVEGNRIWSVTDRPVPGNPAHAEIQREPRGNKPDKAERRRFVEVWRDAAGLLTVLKEEDPRGEPELQLVPGAGVEIHWRAGRDGKPRRVVQVESVSEAVRAYVAAGIVTEADAAEEQRRLQQELASGTRVTRSPRTGTRSG